MSKDTSSIFQKLMRQLSVYSLNETHPDAFTVTRMKKEAKKIITTNQALAASAYGIIAAVQGDLEESERYVSCNVDENLRQARRIVSINAKHHESNA